MAERIRRALEAGELRARHEVLRIRVSIGVAARREGIETLDALLALADAALEEAKAKGRNRVEGTPASS